MQKAEIRGRTWTQSVPPAVAGGSMIGMRHSMDFESNRSTHPLPRVVLTVSKCDASAGLELANAFGVIAASSYNPILQPRADLLNGQTL